VTDPAGKHRVREEADGERREDEREPRMRFGDRLVDDDLPGDRADEHGNEVETDRDRDEVPAHNGEGIADPAPVGPAPPEEGADAGGRGKNDR
jgi:hypothetical protein